MLDDVMDAAERGMIDRLMELRDTGIVAGLEQELALLLRSRIWCLVQETGLRAPELPADESDEVHGLARVCETMECAREYIAMKEQPPSPWPPAELCPASPARVI